jgi:hypothetical protein
MDSKLYIEWRERLKKLVVEYRGTILAQFDTQDEAREWKQRNYPDHGHEIEEFRFVAILRVA